MPVNLALRLSSRFLLGIFLVTLLTACREKLPYSVAGVDLPDLADEPATVARPQTQREGIAEAITFHPSSPGVYEKYIEWLTKKGWTRVSETQEVTLVRSIMAKDGTRLTIVFTPRGGLNISGLGPANPSADAAAKTDN